MKNRLYHLWSVALSLTVLAGCSGCTNTQAQETASPVAEVETSAQEAPYQFSIGYSGTGYDASFTKWKEQISEATDGNVELVLYGENVLGEGKDMIKAVQRGTISIMASSTSVCTAVVPETAILDIPACFPEYCQAFRVYDGEFYEKLNQYYQEKGLELLFLRTGEPWLISSKEPITTLDQLNSFRVRTSGSAYHNKLYEILGIQCIENVGLSGLSYIIQENEVDGIETTYAILNTQGLLEVQPYALEGSFFVMSSAIVMNYDAFHSLPSDYQLLLKQTLKDILSEQQSSMSSIDNSALEITNLTPEDQEELKILAASLLEDILNSVDSSLADALILENQDKTVP